MNVRWDGSSIPNVNGQTIIVTGGNSGIGFQAASMLAGSGAETIIAVRNENKGLEAADRMVMKYPQANVQVMKLDLGDLGSVRAFADKFRERYSKLSVLINNAGVMIPPYQKTKDGFELQFGCNHLGHYALTCLLLPLLRSTPDSRVVTVSSLASKSGTIRFDQLESADGYRAFERYSQSKLENYLFSVELHRRLRTMDGNTISLACHPGIASTNLMSRGSGKTTGKFIKFIFDLVAQPAEMGALPLLYAATATGLQGGICIGPDGKGGRRGYPFVDSSFQKLWDEQIAKRLWEVSASMTGVSVV